MSSSRTLSPLASRNHELRRSFIAIVVISLTFCLAAWAGVIIAAVALL